MIATSRPSLKVPSPTRLSESRDKVLVKNLGAEQRADARALLIPKLKAYAVWSVIDGASRRTLRELLQAGYTQSATADEFVTLIRSVGDAMDVRVSEHLAEHLHRVTVYVSDPDTGKISMGEFAFDALRLVPVNELGHEVDLVGSGQDEDEADREEVAS